MAQPWIRRRGLTVWNSPMGLNEVHSCADENPWSKRPASGYWRPSNRATRQQFALRPLLHERHRRFESSSRAGKGPSPTQRLAAAVSNSLFSNRFTVIYQIFYYAVWWFPMLFGMFGIILDLFGTLKPLWEIGKDCYSTIMFPTCSTEHIRCRGDVPICRCFFEWHQELVCIWFGQLSSGFVT